MTTRPAARGKAGLFERGRLAAHCLLIESDDGLVLVDTGLGLGDVADPTQRLSAFFLRLLKPELRAEMTAVRQIERLGFRSADVRDIVLTHLDFDTAGGLDDFPRARVHLLTRERDFAALQRTWLDRQRFRPQQWSTRNHWVTYAPDDTERWMGLPCVRQLCGLSPDILLVPLRGHTPGHAGVAIKTDAGWLLHAGDAFFDPRELDAHPHCRTGLRLYQRMLDVDRSARLQNQARLRALKQTFPEIDIFCSHDVEAFERLAGRPANTPVEAGDLSTDQWRQKIVRRPEVNVVARANEAAPGIEVHHHDADEEFDFDFERLASKHGDVPRQRT
jgi:glyoxylase-like metal-dependent hydrolase (beta-lactamase superfamily II)